MRQHEPVYTAPSLMASAASLDSGLSPGMAPSNAVAMDVVIFPLLPAPFASDVSEQRDEAGIREEGGSGLHRPESPFCLQRPDPLTGAESFERIRL